MRPLSIAFAALLLQGTAEVQSPRLASIEGIVVKVGVADVRMILPAPGGSGASSATQVRGTGEPVSDATVELTAIAGDRVHSTIVKSGRDGRFAFKDVPPGEDYQLVAIHTPDYVPAQYGQRFPGQPGTSISLTAGQQLKDVRIVMSRAGSISGRSMDAGKPRTGLVYAIRPFYEDGRRILGSAAYGKSGVVAAGVASSNGDYRISGLLPGQYYICLTTTGQMCHTEKDRDEPAPINLRAGDNLTGLNVTLRATDWGILRGEIVSGVYGQAVASTRIGLAPVDAGPDSPGSPLRDSPPTFQLTTRPGAYFLIATANVNGTPMFGYLPVKAHGGEDRRLRVVVEPAFNVTAQVSGNVPANVVVTLQPRILGMPRAPSASILGKGELTLQGVTPGEYRVDVRTPGVPGAYLKSVRFDGKELSDGILRVETDSKSKLEIALGSNGAMIGGNVFREPVAAVLKEFPAAIEGIRVALVPDPARRNRLDLYRDALSDVSGEFRFQGVAPGAYKIFAWELVQDGAWHDPEFIRLYEDYGLPIRVVEGSRNLLDIHFIPGFN